MLTDTVKNLLRCESDVEFGTNDECFPMSADTYEVKIEPFLESDGSYDTEITPLKRNKLDDRYFLVMTNEDISTTQINDELYINSLSKKYESKLSRGFISITGFYGDVSSANGTYRLNREISYVETSDKKIGIGIYINDNKQWYLEYKEDRWLLRDIATGNKYISSNTDDISDGLRQVQITIKDFYRRRNFY